MWKVAAGIPLSLLARRWHDLTPIAEETVPWVSAVILSGILEIHSSHAKAEWTPPRVVRVDAAYYRLEASDRGLSSIACAALPPECRAAGSSFTIRL